MKNKVFFSILKLHKLINQYRNSPHLGCRDFQYCNFCTTTRCLLRAYTIKTSREFSERKFNNHAHAATGEQHKATTKDYFHDQTAPEMSLQFQTVENTCCRFIKKSHHSFLLQHLQLLLLSNQQFKTQRLFF